MFSSSKSLTKIENLQKRALRFLLNDYTSTYENLLEQANRSTMNVNRLRILCIEIYKTINSLNPSFMKNIFKLRERSKPTREQYKLNLDIPKHNQVTYGSKSLRLFGPKIWNSLPYHLKSAANLKSFKSMIKNWNGTSCNCIVCTK